MRCSSGTKKRQTKLTSRCTGSGWSAPWRLNLSLHDRLDYDWRGNAELVLNGAIAQLNAKPRLQRIIITAIVIGIEKLFEPLQKFKVILETTLDQLIDGNYLIWKYEV